MMKKAHIILLIGFVAFISFSCGRKSEGSENASLLIENTTQADAETDALKNRTTDEDAADDPAIWINPTNPQLSRIIGTDKKGGLAVYDLDGKELFYYADGKMNNVDVRQNVVFGDDTCDVAACSNRTTNTIDLYRIATDGSLTSLASPVKVAMDDEVYGFCLAQNSDKTKLYALVNSTNGIVEQWEIFKSDKDQISGKLVRNFALESKTEGMVADDETGVVFIGEEEKGIWKLFIDPEKELSPELIEESEVAKNENIYEDIEGLCIYSMENGKGYLIASSQGNYSYAVFDRLPPHKYLGSFRITDGDFDGVQETDGIEVTSVKLGDKYPYGLFVAQDGYNKDDGKLVAQNFKLVKWEKIAKLFEPELLVEK